MSHQAQAQNGLELLSLQTVLEILCGFESRFNQIEVRFSDFDARFNSLNQVIEHDMRSLKTKMWNGQQRLETRLNTKVATVESSVNFFDDKVMQKFKAMEVVPARLFQEQFRNVSSRRVSARCCH